MNMYKFNIKDTINLCPSKKQWQAWSLPSKLTAVGTFLAILTTVSTLIGAVFSVSQFSNDAYSKGLPDAKDVQGVLAICAAGRIQEVESNLKSIIQELKSKSTKNEESIITNSNVGAIINGIKDDNIRAEVYYIYNDCVKNMVHKFIDANNDINLNSFGDNSANINGSSNTTIIYH